MSNSCVISLRCADKKCGKEYEKKDLYVCEYCFGPLEVNYDYKKIKNDLTIEKILNREKTLWRYKELLPLDSEPTVGLNSGFTPLIKADNLANILEVDELYIKNDGVSFPTLSFKDRVVSVALSKAKELGFDTVGCASTGNLANSVAAPPTSVPPNPSSVTVPEVVTVETPPRSTPPVGSAGLKITDKSVIAPPKSTPPVGSAGLKITERSVNAPPKSTPPVGSAGLWITD